MLENCKTKLYNLSTYLNTCTSHNCIVLCKNHGIKWWYLCKGKKREREREEEKEKEKEKSKKEEKKNINCKKKKKKKKE